MQHNAKIKGRVAKKYGIENAAACFSLTVVYCVSVFLNMLCNVSANSSSRRRDVKGTMTIKTSWEASPSEGLLLAQ